MSVSIKDFVDGMVQNVEVINTDKRRNREEAIEAMSDKTRIAIQSAVNGVLRGDDSYLVKSSSNDVNVHYYQGILHDVNRLRVVISSDFIHNNMFPVIGGMYSNVVYYILYRLFLDMVREMNKQSLDHHYELQVSEYDKDWRGSVGVINNCSFTVIVTDSTFTNKLISHGLVKAFKHFYL